MHRQTPNSLGGDYVVLNASWLDTKSPTLNAKNNITTCIQKVS